MINRKPAQNDCLSPICDNIHHLIPIQNDNQNSNDSIDSESRWKCKLISTLIIAPVGIIAIILCFIFNNNLPIQDHDQIQNHSIVIDRYLLKHGNQASSESKEKESNPTADNTVAQNELTKPLQRKKIKLKWQATPLVTDPINSAINPAAEPTLDRTMNKKKKLGATFKVTAPDPKRLQEWNKFQQVMNEELYTLESYWFMLAFNNFCLNDRTKVLEIENGLTAAKYTKRHPRRDVSQTQQNQIKQRYQILNRDAQQFHTNIAILAMRISYHIDNYMLPLVYGDEKQQMLLKDDQWIKTPYQLKMQQMLQDIATMPQYFNSEITRKSDVFSKMIQYQFDQDCDSIAFNVYNKDGDVLFDQKYSKKPDKIKILGQKIGDLLNVHEKTIAFKEPESVENGGIRLHFKIHFTDSIIDEQLQSLQNSREQQDKLAKIVEESYQLDKTPVIGNFKYSQHKSKLREGNAVDVQRYQYKYIDQYILKRDNLWKTLIKVWTEAFGISNRIILRSQATDQEKWRQWLGMDATKNDKAKFIQIVSNLIKHSDFNDQYIEYIKATQELVSSLIVLYGKHLEWRLKFGKGSYGIEKWRRLCWDISEARTVADKIQQYNGIRNGKEIYVIVQYGLTDLREGVVELFEFIFKEFNPDGAKKYGDMRLFSKEHLLTEEEAETLKPKESIMDPVLLPICDFVTSKWWLGGIEALNQMNHAACVPNGFSTPYCQAIGIYWALISTELQWGMYFLGQYYKTGSIEEAAAMTKRDFVTSIKHIPQKLLDAFAGFEYQVPPQEAHHLPLPLHRYSQQHWMEHSLEQTRITPITLFFEVDEYYLQNLYQEKFNVHEKKNGNLIEFNVYNKDPAVTLDQEHIKSPDKIKILQRKIRELLAVRGTKITFKESESVKNGGIKLQFEVYITGSIIDEQLQLLQSSTDQQDKLAKIVEESYQLDEKPVIGEFQYSEFEHKFITYRAITDTTRIKSLVRIFGGIDAILEFYLSDTKYADAALSESQKEELWLKLSLLMAKSTDYPKKPDDVPLNAAYLVKLHQELLTSGRIRTNNYYELNIVKILGGVGEILKFYLSSDNHDKLSAILSRNNIPLRRIRDWLLDIY